MKRILLVAVGLMICLASMFACGKADAVPDVPEQPGEQMPQRLLFAENGEAKFQVVYDKTASISDKNLAQRVANALSQATGITFVQKAAGAYSEAAAAAYEILIGSVDRPEAEAAMGELREDGAYIIRVSGRKIVIAGKSDDARKAAVEYFITTYVNGHTDIDAKLEYRGVWTDPTKNSDGTTIPNATNKTQRVIYKIVGQVELSMMIYRPNAVGEDEKTPLLIVFPGGGWRAADISSFAGYNAEAAYLKERGWTIAVAEYRLRSDSGNTDYPELASDCSLAGMISDCMDAVRYLVKYADVLGVDTDAICTGGHSAGGLLALMTALGDPNDFTQHSNLTDFTFTIAAATAKSGPTDCNADAMRKSYVPLIFPSGFTADDLTKCSPISYVSADMCPVLIGYGENDQIFTPSSQWEAFGAKCDAAGATQCRLIAQKNVDHSTTTNAAITNAIQSFLMQQVGE
ncbi:MAG: alpha/beta hydrolase [Clostridia bacterium]|nr:alpha/beta hydrolase [Clostridia bacterium]